MPTNHLGQEVTADSEFFVPAPASIGAVLSQNSTRKTSDQGTVSKTHVNIALVFLVIAAIFGVLYFITKNTMMLAGVMLFGAFAMLPALNTKRYERNYVRRQGRCAIPS